MSSPPADPSPGGIPALVTTDPQVWIFAPVAAMVALTFLVLFGMGSLRMSGMLTGRLSTDYYRYLRPDEDPEPEVLRGFTRNFINLLEVPVLFYVGCVTAYVTAAVDGTLVDLAWVFVGGRVIHSAIHLTYNHPWHRAAAFLFSSAIVLAFWVILILRLF